MPQGSSASLSEADLALLASVVVGCRVFAYKADPLEPTEKPVSRTAEVISITTGSASNGLGLRYYLHWEDFNKRLDEWVGADRLDLARGIEPPKKKSRPGQDSTSAGKQPSSKTPSSKSKAKSTKKAAKTPQSKITGGRGDSTPSPAANAPLTVSSTVPGSNKRKSRGSEPSTPGPQDDSSTPVNTPGPDSSDLPEEGTFSKEQEIEKLRHGGSMTQSVHEISRVKNLNRIRMGAHEVEAWYFSPYPEELSRCEVVYICEFCLSPLSSLFQHRRHRAKCLLQHPPGNEIYRQGDISFFEIDGRKQKVYCRNLCLISKLFLDHKTLYYDVDPFLFYVMCKTDEHGAHIVGYFSKEKESMENYNLACILTLPQYQRQGWGRILIAFSYELSKAEGKIGSPEKPLSDLGLLSYRAYWAEAIIERLIDYRGEVTIEEISAATGITPQDILHTLQSMDALKYYRGQHVICLTEKSIKSYEKATAKARARIDRKYLQWDPPKFNNTQLRWI